MSVEIHVNYYITCDKKQEGCHMELSLVPLPVEKVRLFADSQSWRHIPLVSTDVDETYPSGSWVCPACDGVLRTAADVKTEIVGGADFSTTTGQFQYVQYTNVPMNTDRVTLSGQIV